MSLFDKIGSKITEAGQGVQEQAKQITEITKINSLISSNERDISNLYMELGKEYFNSINGKPQDIGVPFVKKINQLSQDVKELRETLSDLKGIVFCNKCNAESPLSANCCSQCGTPLTKPEPKTAPACGNCGKNIEGNAKFCTGCGTPISS